MGTTQSARSAATREKAIAATIACLLERGYAGTSIGAICDRAGLSRGALTHQWADKQSLVIDTIDEITARVADAIPATLDETAPGRARIEEGLDALWAGFTGEVFVAGLEVYVGARTDPRLRAHVRELEARVDARARASLAAIVGCESPEVSARADLLVHTVRGIALLWTTGGPRDQLAASWARAREAAVRDLLALARA